MSKKKSEEPSGPLANYPTDATSLHGSNSVRRPQPLPDPMVASTTPLDGKSSGASASGNSSAAGASAQESTASSKPKTNVETIVPITLDYLREHKSFAKLLQKQEKELASMRKKHSKEQSLLNEQQSKVISKVRTEMEKLGRLSFSNSGNSPKKPTR